MIREGGMGIGEQLAVSLEEATVRIPAAEFDRHIAELRALLDGNVAGPADMSSLRDTVDALERAAKR